MLSVRVQPPTFFAERAIDRLVGRLPSEALARLRANLRAFRAWVAEPAYRADGGPAAVQHVLASVGPSVQLKADFLMALASVPRGFELFFEAVTDELLDIVPEDGPEVLTRATEHLVRAQRVWFRLMLFHPDLDGVERAVGNARLSETLTIGFHADNLLTVCFMAMDGESGRIAPAVLDTLLDAAADFSARYHAAVTGLAEAVAPQVDEQTPFEPSALADLLALPPCDSPPLTPEEMDEAITAQFRAS